MSRQMRSLCTTAVQRGWPWTHPCICNSSARARQRMRIPSDSPSGSPDACLAWKRSVAATHQSGRASRANSVSRLTQSVRVLNMSSSGMWTLLMSEFSLKHQWHNGISQADRFERQVRCYCLQKGIRIELSCGKLAGRAAALPDERGTHQAHVCFLM